jgi:hypothetical protein
LLKNWIGGTVKEGNRKTRTMVKESLRDDNEIRCINFGKCIIKVFPGRKWGNFGKCIIKVFPVPPCMEGAV